MGLNHFKKFTHPHKTQRKTDSALQTVTTDNRSVYQDLWKTQISEKSDDISFSISLQSAGINWLRKTFSIGFKVFKIIQ